MTLLSITRPHLGGQDPRTESLSRLAEQAEVQNWRSGYQTSHDTESSQNEIKFEITSKITSGEQPKDSCNSSGNGMESWHVNKMYCS